MRKLTILLLLFFCAFSADAQKVQYTEKDYASKPVWIQMIRDTSTNFYEAEKAFNTYFKHHEKPEGEEEEIGDHKEKEKHPSKRERRKIQAEYHLRMDIKTYERWHDKMLPYVQSDGTILGPEQRLQIWRDQQKIQQGHK